MLSPPLNKPEIFKLIKNVELNKTLGIDGFPVEIYEENWDIIDNGFLAIYESILDINCLGDSQSQANITLIVISNNTRTVTDFRSIHLPYIIYKIL